MKKHSSNAWFGPLAVVGLFLFCACGGMPKLDGVLVYPSEKGIQAQNLKTGETWFVLEQAGVSDLATDRQGTQIIFSVLQENRQVLMRYRIATKAIEPLCRETDYDPPWRVGQPAVSPLGDWISFTSRDVLGLEKLELVLGSGVCRPVAEEVPAATWAPGADRLLLTDGKSLAIHTVADPAEPWRRPKGGLAPILQVEEGTVRSLAVTRNLDRFAVLNGNAISIHEFSSPKRKMTIDLGPILSRVKSGYPVPERMTFSPDGRYLAVSCGPAESPSFLLVSGDGKAIKRGRSAVAWTLNPKLTLGQPAWVPSLLKN